ncbi:MAG: putative Fe-S cluster assembly protein SufT [Gammaproteobacteria bacterium TMED78]|nr:MAG: putative Fe-S cluster assembly protein SufT [Gammaproteobacteria bacterium TMED78]|tara:strand:+ start:22512 stop:23063 length:552 start_codon:yes stop_codon:yes gene_type:complete
MYSHHNEPVTFIRDCQAVLIPSGELVSLSEGTVAFITQTLGGSFTVMIEGNLFRIAGIDADAIGKESIKPPEVPSNASDSDIEAIIWDQMKTCFDPEIPINIVDLGLIYNCSIEKNNSDRFNVQIDMTLTAPGCGMGDILAEDVKEKIKIIPQIEYVEVLLVFEPPWDQSMMSEVAKLEAGLL